MDAKDAALSMLAILSLVAPLRGDAAAAVSPGGQPDLRTVDVGGAELHYVERGEGEAMVLVHGTLDDYSMWLPHLDALDDHYRVVAYMVDRPDLVQTLVLVEPPVDPAALDLSRIPGLDAARAGWLEGWSRYGEAVRAGQTREAIRLFIDDVQGEPGFAERLPEAAWTAIMRNAREFEALVTSSEPFPPVRPEQLRGFAMPTLVVLGGRNVGGIFERGNDRLVQLLPGAESVTVPDADHQLWWQQPELARAAVLGFLARWDR